MEEITGRQVLEWFARRSDTPGWHPIWTVVAALGSPDFFAVALPVLFAFAPMRWALRLGLAFALSSALSETIKALIGRPRLDPTLFGLPGALEDPGVYASAAFPSGHVLMAVVLWGTVAVHVRSNVVRGLCAALVAAIATSRLALLRHDLLDVAGGLVLGGLLLTVLVVAERAWGDSLSRLPRVERGALWLLVPMALQAVAGLEITALVLGVGAGVGVGAIAGAGWRRRVRRPSVALGVVRTVLAVGGVALVRSFAEPGAGLHPWTLFAIYTGAAVWVAGVVPALFGGVYERSET